MKRVEEPCAIDKEPCDWVSEEEYTPDGNLITDAYCSKCFRARDWSKDELKR